MPKTKKLLALDEVFIYRVPPIKFSGGYRAEDWNLSKPLQTCSVIVEQIDVDICLVKFFVDKITEDGFDVALFAQCNIILTPDKRRGGLEQYLENVLDSSRYFVVKIEDKKTSRTAKIGIGFRERHAASSFRKTLIEFYEDNARMNSDRIDEDSEEETERGEKEEKIEKVSIYAQDIQEEDPENRMRKLSLMDWENIHSNEDAATLTGEVIDDKSSYSTGTAEETVDDDVSSITTGLGASGLSVDSGYSGPTGPRRKKKTRKVPAGPSSRILQGARMLPSGKISLSRQASIDESMLSEDSNSILLNEELAAREEQIQKLQSQLTGLQGNLQTTTGDLAKKEAETNSLCQTLTKAIKYIEEYKGRVQDLEETQTKLESELDSSKNLNRKMKVERYELETNLGNLMTSNNGQ